MNATHRPDQLKPDQLVSTLTQCKQSSWPFSRIFQSTAWSIARCAFFTLLGIATGLLIAHRSQSASAPAGGSRPRFPATHSVGVHFLSESCSPFNSFPPDTIVNFSVTEIDLDSDEIIVVVEDKSYPIQQLRDALKIVAVLKSSAAESSSQQSAAAPPATGSGLAAEHHAQANSPPD